MLKKCKHLNKRNEEKKYNYTNREKKLFSDSFKKV